MEMKLTPEALKARTEEIARQFERSRDRRLAGLMTLYGRLSDDVDALAELWKRARRQAEEALARIEAGVLPGTFYSLLQPGAEIDRVEARVEALRDAITVIEAELNAPTDAAAKK